MNTIPKQDNFDLVIFDVDGTLVTDETNKWYAITLGLGANIELHKKIYTDFKNKQIDLVDAIAGIENLWKNSTNATQNKIESILADIHLRPGAKEFVNKLKSKNIANVVITGTPEYHMQKVMEELNITEGFTCSHFTYDKNGYLEKFSYPVDSTVEKHFLYKEFISTHGYLPSRCIMIGDGANDKLIMQDVALSCCPTDTNEPEIIKLADITFKDFYELESMFS